MPDPVPEHPPGRDSIPSSATMACGTAGQRAAAVALGEALAKRQPLILLFGEAGVGKSTLIGSFLTTVDPGEFAIVQLSATSGEFTSPPSFDVLLEVICRRLVAPQPTAQRPATLAVLAIAVGAIAGAGRTVVIAIDHADHLTDDVISEAAKLSKYLDVPPASLVCIFIGSPTLASRLDAVLRKPGAAGMTEIRLSQPSSDELAALLAYEDTAQLGGPMLTSGAIDRISVYAKSNLHWAVPLADAARTLATDQGEREVTPELVRGALLELWSPDQPQPSDVLTPSTLDPTESTSFAGAAVAGMSDVQRRSPTGAEAREQPGSSAAVDQASTVSQPPVFSEDPLASSAAVPEPTSTRRQGVLWIALAALALLIVLGIIAVFLRQAPDPIGREQPASDSPASDSPASDSPASDEPALQPPGRPQDRNDVEDSTPQQGESGQLPPAQPSGLPEPDAERGETPASHGDQSSTTLPPVSNAAPTPRAPGAPSPPVRAPTTKKPVPPKAPKSDDGEVPSRWIQTR